MAMKYLPQQCFEDVYEALREYRNKRKNDWIPYTYKTKEGIALGRIFCDIRNGKRKVTSMQRKLIEDLGFSLEVKKKVFRSTEEIIKLLEEYKRKYHDLHVPEKYKTEQGVCLGRYVQSIRQGIKEVTLEQKKKLDEMGFVWKK